MEMLLVVGLTMTFAGAAVISMAPLWRNAPLDEGVGRFEGLLRFARAEAAQQGRRVRLQVTTPVPSPDGRVGPAPAVQVEWEPEPLSQPGVFVENVATSALAQSLGELVRVESLRHVEPESDPLPPSTDTPPPVTDQPAGPPAASAGAEVQPPDESAPDAGSFSSITFYPDGSSDSAEILLAGLDPEDTRRMVVRWNGFSGTAQHGVSRGDGAAGGESGAAGSAQPLEPSSVADSAMGPVAP